MSGRCFWVWIFVLLLLVSIFVGVANSILLTELRNNAKIVIRENG
jgi:hypothetical protein